jgi:hypothetical protein
VYFPLFLPLAAVMVVTLDLDKVEAAVVVQVHPQQTQPVPECRGKDLVVV